MAAASSIAPPTTIHSSLVREEKVLFAGMDGQEVRAEEEEDAAGSSDPPGVPLRDLPDLEPEEIERRLAKTRQELSNRRKILIKNLPQDTTNQEVHEFLKDYELKYCFVDRNKGTAFVTLLNGAQAQDAIRSLHHSSVRGGGGGGGGGGRCVSVALQPTDALLCLANLPHAFSARRLEELVRAYGNIERCFLVYSRTSGHSKGYGFVEYMKKDSASRARSELLGRPQGDRALMVQWMDVNQLTQEQQLHSRCLCVDRLPLDLSSSQDLTRLFSRRYKPLFCQLAQDEGSAVRGFGVVEYETPEQAEAVLLEMDRTLLGGQELRLSLCTPGASGRSTLAALIAAQGVMLGHKKGLLPEPSLAHLLSSISPPTALQLLLRPLPPHGRRGGGKYGRHHSLPFLRPPITSALLTLGKAHQQSAMLGNGLVLQNLLHMQLAQQQLQHIKEKRVAGLLSDPSRLLLHKALALRATGPGALGKGLLEDPPPEFLQDASPLQTLPSSAGISSSSSSSMMPYKPGRASSGPEHNGFHSSPPAYSSSSPSSSCSSSVITFSASSRPPAPPGALVGVLPQGQSFSLGSGCGLAPPPPPKDPGGLQAAPPPHGFEGYPPPPGTAGVQGSLLGEPPKEVKIPSNPYLNLASVMPGMVLQGPVGGKAQAGPPVPGLYGSSLAPPAPQGSGALCHGAAVAPPPPQYPPDAYADYSQYSQVYTQEAMQQWYHQYQAAAQVQNYNNATAAPDSLASDYSKEQAPAVSSYGEYGSYMQAVTQYYTQAPPTGQPYGAKEVSLHAVAPAPPTAVLPAAVLPAYGALPLMPGFLGAPHPAGPPPGPAAPAAAAATDWGAYYYNQARGQKREYPQLAVQEVTSSEGAYIGQHSQGLGGQYADYFKRKRL